MKKITSLVLFAFVSALLLAYTFKKKEFSLTAPDGYVSCYAMESKDMIQADAGKPGFAALHIAPKPFVLENQKGKMISFKSNDGIDAKGYFLKSNKKSNKWLIVIQEWWGLNDNIKKEAETYYSELDNINVLAVDMYDGKIASTPDSAMTLMRNAKSERLENIIKAAIAYAGSDAKIYTVGWCFGGGWSLQTSILAGKQAEGCVMYYGRPEKNIDKLKSLHCDVIGFFGNLDQGISKEVVNSFESNMKEAGKNISLYRYEAGHGFANPSNPVFNKDAAADAHAKAIQFLKERMK